MKVRITPLNIVSLASGFNGTAKVIDENIHKLNIIEELSDFKPDIVFLSFNTISYNYVKSLCNIIRNFDKNILIVLGGCHASSKPSETLRDTKADIVVVGEGESFIKEGNFKKQRGIVYSKPISNLDDLPMPKWDLIDVNDYDSSRLYAKNNPSCLLESSRGCPHRCYYCNKSVFGYKIRGKTVNRIIEDISSCMSYGFKEFSFADDFFNYNIKRAIDICKKINEMKINISWTLNNGMRVDNVNEELFRSLNKAGCYRTSFGIESGNQKVLDSINKGTKLDQIKNAVELCNKNNILTVGFFIIGLPEDNKETVRETIDFAKKLPLDYIRFSVFMPQVSTELWDLFKDRINKNVNYDDIRYLPNKQLYDHPNLEWNEILEFMDIAYNEFYLRPSYILRRLKTDIFNGYLIDDIKGFLGTKWR
ncbi:radical SAM protein [Candidatus Pacearchaeota archaeon]|nr:radical SAM protein [Candidatus Pacearchaeota archaeon]